MLPEDLTENHFVFSGTTSVNVQDRRRLRHGNVLCGDCRVADLGGTTRIGFLALPAGGGEHAFLVYGSGLTYENGVVLTGGTITSIQVLEPFTVLLNVPAPIASMDNLSIDAAALGAAIAEFQASSGSNTAQLDAIFGNLTYSTVGNAGDDTLLSGRADDYLHGGVGGNDEFVFFENNGDDTVGNFSQIETDKIVLDGIYTSTSDQGFLDMLATLASGATPSICRTARSSSSASTCRT